MVMKGLIEKLKILGYTIKYIANGDKAIIIRDNTIKKDKLIQVNGDAVKSSDYYDSIQYFGNDKYIIFDKGIYSIVDDSNITHYKNGFTSVEGIIENSLKTSNAIVSLSNQYFGVINSLDITVIPFIYSNINLYKLNEDYIYYCSLLDRKVLFNDIGVEYKVSERVSNKANLVFDQGILIIDKINSIIELYDLNNQLKIKGTKLVKSNSGYIIKDKEDIVYEDLILATDIK